MRVIWACLFLVILAGCSFDTNQVETPDPLDPTALYATSLAQVTMAAQSSGTGQAISLTGVSLTLTAGTTAPMPTLARTQAPLFTPSSATGCNAAVPGTPMDITIRDDTEMSPGSSFTKTWRLQNAGTCKWSRMYSLVYFSGNPMAAIQVNYLSGEVFPGDMVDLSVDMVAPSKPGVYQSNWMLADANGNLFGIGPNGDAPFWARIQVIEMVTPTLTPTITLTPTPIIYREGIISIVSGDALDLDTGNLNPEGDFADLIYQLTSPMYQLVPINGAGMRLFGETVPSFSDCRNAMVGSNTVEFEAINPESYACYRTNMGQPGRLHLLSFDDINDILKLEFITWSIP